MAATDLAGVPAGHETQRDASSTGGQVGPALAVLLAALGTSIANVALPGLARGFAAPFPTVQWVVLGYLLAVTVAIVSAGHLGDRFGHRRMLTAGLGLFAAAAALAAAAPTIGWLIAARVIQGAAAALMMALPLALLRATTPAARLGRTMGLLGTMSAIGTALGPSLGGLILAVAGWRGVFALMAVLGLAGMALLARQSDGPRVKPATGRFDGRGMAVLALTVTAYALAMTVGGALTMPTLLGLAALGLVIFWRIERHAAPPVLPLAALGLHGLGSGLTMNALVATVMMATLVVGPFYLGGGLHLSEVQAGLALSVGPVIAAISGLPSGWAVDRLGGRRAVRMGLAAMMVGSAGLALLPPALGLAGYLAAVAVLTPGYQLFLAANTTTVMCGAAPDARGMISSLVNLSRNLGLITGAAAMAAIFARASGTDDPVRAGSGALTTGMQVTFAVGVGLILIALVVSWRTDPADSRAE
jgi:MFS family permease